jgi:hypothetical protein
MAAKKSRQVRRAEQRKADATAPAAQPLVRIEVSIDDANIIAAGLSELPVKVSLKVLNLVGGAIQRALTVGSKTKKKAKP